MVNTIHTYNKISQGITEGNGKHAVSTQPLLFSNSKNNEDYKERAEWAWILKDVEDE